MGIFKHEWQKSQKVIGVILLISALVGLMASFTLLHDTLSVARDSSFSPVCNINPVLSCTSVMESSQAEFFGMPNPAFGLVAFGALMAFAVLLIADVKMPRWVWLAGLGVSGAGLLFTLHLYITSVFSLGTICLWCFGTWLVTIALFWAIFTYVLAHKLIEFTGLFKKIGEFWVKNAGLVLAVWYAILIFVILIKFRESLFL